MALRGTLGDFGIADIFQLVGHQSKTGILRMKNRSQELSIYFVDGSIVKTQEKNRPKSEMLGSLMVRAQVIDETQLEQALEEQSRRNIRLGAALTHLRHCSQKDVHEFARLQTTEAIYGLFKWEQGTYEFTQEEFDYDEDSYLPMRTDNVLMEGFRILDELPSVEGVIPHSDLTFRKLKSPEIAESEAPASDDEFDLEAAFSDAPAKPKSDLGDQARAVFELVDTGLDVRTIADRARLGKFDASRALAELVRKGYLAVDVEHETERRSRGSVQHRLRKVLTRMLTYALLIACFAGIVRVLSLSDSAIFAQRRSEIVSPGAVTRTLANLQRARLRRFIARHRLLEGGYPERLSELTSTTENAEHETAFPYRGEYAYETKGADVATGRPASFSVGRPLR